MWSESMKGQNSSQRHKTATIMYTVYSEIYCNSKKKKKNPHVHLTKLDQNHLTDMHLGALCPLGKPVLMAKCFSLWYLTFSMIDHRLFHPQGTNIM